MEKTNEVVNNYFTISAQETRQTKNKHKRNLLIITVSCVKKICLVRSKKKNYRKLKNRTINKSEHVAK